jgi:hypothetical protein
MGQRRASASRLESTDKLAGTYVAICAAGGGLAVAAGAPGWVVITLAVVGMARAVAGFVLKVLYERSKQAEAAEAAVAAAATAATALWARPPLPVRDAVAERYDLGVGWEAQEALEALDDDLAHAPYLERDGAKAAYRRAYVRALSDGDDELAEDAQAALRSLAGGAAT